MNKMKRGIAQITDVSVAYGVVAVIIVTLLIPLTQWAADEYRMNVAAGQANTVQKAINRYIADQQATIAANSSASVGYTLTVPMLISAGYLPDGYSPTNAYTATYRTLIFQPATNKFHTMTFLTGGSALSLSDARTLANHIGAAGGYIENGVAKGALGSWQENLSAFGGYNPGDGSVVIAGFYSNGALVNDYLYRHSVAGHPELNTMGTTLNMGNNDISSAKTIDTQTLNASADVNTTRLTASQNIQSNGTINANGNITAGNDVTANGTLRAAHDAVIGGVIKPLQVNTAGTYCDTWGAISHDSTGAILSCQSGVWRGTGNSTVYPGFIDYGSHVEMYGTIYGIGDDSCVNATFPTSISQILSLTGSVSDLSSLANAGVTSAYFTVINTAQFRVCVKNKDSSRSNNVTWRAIGIR